MSPLVAVRITISLPDPFLAAAVVIRWGKIESAISLKAIVGPWKSSRYQALPDFLKGAISSVSNLLS